VHRLVPVIRYLFVLSCSFLMGHLFCELFNLLFFIRIDSSFIIQKKKYNSDPELCQIRRFLGQSDGRLDLVRGSQRHTKLA
jgi:hypothetical protein